MKQNIGLHARFGWRWVCLLVGVLGLATALRAEVVKVGLVGIYDASAISGAGENVIILGPVGGPVGGGSYASGRYYGDVEQYTVDGKTYYRLPTDNTQIGLRAGDWFVLGTGFAVGAETAFTGYRGNQVPDPTIKTPGSFSIDLGTVKQGTGLYSGVSSFASSSTQPPLMPANREGTIAKAQGNPDNQAIVVEWSVDSSLPLGKHFVGNLSTDASAGADVYQLFCTIVENGTVTRSDPAIRWASTVPDSVRSGQSLRLDVQAMAPGGDLQQITLEARYQMMESGSMVNHVVPIAADPYVGGSSDWQAIGNPFSLSLSDGQADVAVTLVAQARTLAGLSATAIRTVMFKAPGGGDPGVFTGGGGPGPGPSGPSGGGSTPPTIGGGSGPAPQPRVSDVASGTINVVAPSVACTFDWETAKFAAVPSNLAEPVTFAWQVDNLDIGGGSSQSAKLAGGGHRVAVKMTGSDGTEVNAAQDFTMPTPLPPFPRVILTADRSTWRATGKVRIHWEIIPVPGPSTWRP